MTIEMRGRGQAADRWSKLPEDARDKMLRGVNLYRADLISDIFA